MYLQTNVIMVYVDDMYKYKMGGLNRMKMSHMVADTTEELLEMANKLGLPRMYLQYAGAKKEHFDVSMNMRKKAIELGAKELTWKQLGVMVLSRPIKKDSFLTQKEVELEERVQKDISTRFNYL